MKTDTFLGDSLAGSDQYSYERRGDAKVKWIGTSGGQIMRLVFTVFMCAATVLFCLLAKSHAITLTAEDIAFLKSCNIEQVDIDAIPHLPEDGQVNLESILESPRKHCNRDIIISFKATREYLKKFTPPPPAGSPAPVIPAKYNRIYLTPSEQSYISEADRKLFKN